MALEEESSSLADLADLEDLEDLADLDDLEDVDLVDLGDLMADCKGEIMDEKHTDLEFFESEVLGTLTLSFGFKEGVLTFLANCILRMQKEYEIILSGSASHNSTETHLNLTPEDDLRH